MIKKWMTRRRLRRVFNSTKFKNPELASDVFFSFSMQIVMRLLLEEPDDFFAHQKDPYDFYLRITKRVSLALNEVCDGSIRQLVREEVINGWEG